MFEIPLKIIFIKPEIDIILIIFLLYNFLLVPFYRSLLKTDIGKIFWNDLKITAILLLVGYINYSGLKINFFGIKVEWWSYIILIQFLIETLFIFLYKKD